TGPALAAKFLCHCIVGQIGDMADHARNTQTAFRHDTMGIIIAAVKIRVRGDGLAGYFVECDVLCRELWCGRYDDGVPHARRLANGPLHGLHCAKTPAHHRGESVDAEPRREPRLCFHPVLHRDDRKGSSPGLAGGSIDAGRSRGTMTTADVIDADHEEAVGIDRLPWANEVIPPTHVARIVGIASSNMMRCIERMTNQHR